MTQPDTTTAAELADALLAQEPYPDGQPGPYTREQNDAIDALLEAFGTDTADVSGFAMVAGQSLLIVTKVGEPIGRTERGGAIYETEV